jgi:hypothetical protein
VSGWWHSLPCAHRLKTFGCAVPPSRTAIPCVWLSLAAYVYYPIFGVDVEVLSAVSPPWPGLRRGLSLEYSGTPRHDTTGGEKGSGTLLKGNDGGYGADKMTRMPSEEKSFQCVRPLTAAIEGWANCSPRLKMILSEDGQSPTPAGERREQGAWQPHGAKAVRLLPLPRCIY